MHHVTQSDIERGLVALGLERTSAIIVHSSLRSFGHVEGGAKTVCAALRATCGTVVMPASSWDLTNVPAPPGLIRPHNAVVAAASWEGFDAALMAASTCAPDLPIDRELGAIPECLRREFGAIRSNHPLFAYQAIGPHAESIIRSQSWQDPLAPLAALEALDGCVLLMGVSHSSNTAIHLAEQHLGRSRFWRYAKIGEGVWAEFPNIPGESDAFDDIEPALRPVTREARIGQSRVRLVPIRDVVATATRMIEADPGALLAANADPGSRTDAALQQRRAHVAAGNAA